MSFLAHLAITFFWHHRPSSINFSHFNLLIWNPSAKWTETWSVCEIILDRRPTSSWNCCGPVNSCGHRTAVSSRKSVCSPVLIIFYFNSDSWYKNFYTWFPATSQYDLRSMSLSKKHLKGIHWFVIVNWKHWFVIVNVSWKVSQFLANVTDPNDPKDKQNKAKDRKEEYKEYESKKRSRSYQTAWESEFIWLRYKVRM